MPYIQETVSEENSVGKDRTENEMVLLISTIFRLKIAAPRDMYESYKWGGAKNFGRKLSHYIRLMEFSLSVFINSNMASMT
jgi:hypothetical protein